MSMDMIRGKEKNIIISREKKNKIYLFSFTAFFLLSLSLVLGRRTRNLFLLKLSDLLHMLKIFPPDR